MTTPRPLCAIPVLALAALALPLAAPHAAAQTPVPYTSTGWSDFGTSTIAGVMGNFLPGWTTLTGSPDLGQNVFFIPTQSLSGPATDAALWLLKFDQTHPGFGGNEATRLSLSGFTPGQQYRLDFHATLVLSTFAGWNSTADDLQVDLLGADITTWSSSVLNDVGNHDGFNAWTPQTIVFTATNPTVDFRFNLLPVNLDPALVGRIGIDGMSATEVPAPAAALPLCALAMAVAGRRRERSTGLHTRT